MDDQDSDKVQINYRGGESKSAQDEADKKETPEKTAAENKETEKPEKPTPSIDKLHEDQGMGIGQPNIGVEKELEDKTETPVAPATASDDQVVNFTPPSQFDKKSLDETPEIPAAPFENNTIDVQESDMPINKYDEGPKIPSQPSPVGLMPAADAPTHPVSASGTRTGASLVFISLLVLFVGVAAGFYGYRYLDQSRVVNADTKNTTQATPTPNSSEDQIFTSNIYGFSIEYPTDWLSSTSDSDAKKVIFAANQESLYDTPTTFRVAISAEGLAGKTLSNWVKAETSSTTGAKEAKEIKVDQKAAFQQEISGTIPQVATYLEANDQVIKIIYSAPSSKFGEGGELYNTMIRSINFSK